MTSASAWRHRIRSMAGPSFGVAPHQRLLGADAVVVADARRAPVRAQLPGVLAVVQIGLQRFVDDALAQLGVEHRPGHLDAAEHIAAHPVGTGQVERLAGIGFAGLGPAEIADPRVLQEAAHHRAHDDVVADARQARRQHAGTAHDQVHLGAGLGGAQQRVDELGVGQGIDLDDHAGMLVAGQRRSLDLAEQLDHAAVHIEWRQQHAARQLELAQRRELAEHRIGIRREVGVGRQQAQVGVQACRLGVVVAGRDMGIAAQLAVLAARDHQQLGMGLVADDAIDDLGADRLQPLGPVDVGLFVETRLQLDDGHHLLAAPRRLDQQVHQLGLRAGAVDGLLDDQHVGVIDRLAQQLHHRLEALERVMQQHITLLQAVEDRLVPRQPAYRPGRLEGREAQAWRIGLVDQLVQAHQVDRPIDAVQRRAWQAELFEQKGRQLGRAAVHHLQPHRTAEMAGRQARAQRVAQVGDLFLVHFEVGVARDAELREGLDLAAREQLLQMGADHAGQQHEGLAAIAEAGRQLDDARQHARHLDDGDAVVAAEGILARQPRDEMQRLVGHLRKRVGRIQPDRHQQRPHLALEKLLHPAPLGLVAVGMVEDDDALLQQQGHDLLVEDPVLLVDQRVGGPAHAVHILVGDGAERVARSLQHVREAHLEELVEIAGHDADIAQPLQQRHVLALGLGQHPAVELEDGLFAVEQLQRGGVGHGQKCMDDLGARHRAPFG
mmetsp:Transcript_100847/g.281024  ORF Transcript_100847/g.281024 Transcript_100847/m.281024 type:complete len:722 (+) Transcript_100847:177-2342(+)